MPLLLSLKVLEAHTTDRFWSYVDKSGECWEWTGARSHFGYGVFGVAGVPCNVPASRYSWTIHFGDIPPGLLVCHKCDNPPCVRPDHLFLGTAADNINDMISKGRHAAVTRPDYAPRGERVNTAKLTESEVREIRHLRSIGIRRKALAERFGLSPMSISRITSRVTWRHVP